MGNCCKPGPPRKNTRPVLWSFDLVGERYDKNPSTKARLLDPIPEEPFPDQAALQIAISRAVVPPIAYSTIVLPPTASYDEWANALISDLTRLYEALFALYGEDNKWDDSLCALNMVIARDCRIYHNQAGWADRVVLLCQMGDAVRKLAVDWPLLKPSSAVITSAWPYYTV